MAPKGCLCPGVINRAATFILGGGASTWTRQSWSTGPKVGPVPTYGTGHPGQPSPPSRKTELAGRNGRKTRATPLDYSRDQKGVTQIPFGIQSGVLVSKDVTEIAATPGHSNPKTLQKLPLRDPASGGHYTSDHHQVEPANSRKGTSASPPRGNTESYNK